MYSFNIIFTVRGKTVIKFEQKMYERFRQKKLDKQKENFARQTNSQKTKSDLCLKIVNFCH